MTDYYLAVLKLALYASMASVESVVETASQPHISA